MSVLQQIACAAIESLGGGGGIYKFFDRQIELMPDHERTVLANKLSTVMPELTEKFQKIQKYETWFQSLLVEDRWYSKIRKDVFWQSCRIGINDTNVTLERLGRNLHQVLDKFVPGWKVASIYEGDDLSVPNVEYYMLGELDDARARFLGIYPNATWLEVDEEVLAKRREAEAEVAKAEAAKEADYRRWAETLPEVLPWYAETGKAAVTAEHLLDKLKSGSHGIDKDAVDRARAEVHRTRAADDVIRQAAMARQEVQKKRLEDGLPMYGPDEGPERLVARSDLEDNLGST